jgi:cytochrome P450
MTVRQAHKDDIFNGIKIPKGTPIFIGVGINNFDKRSWGEDAEQFNPDRWDSLPEASSNYSFLTFLQGI